jgi:hypothetical protein
MMFSSVLLSMLTCAAVLPDQAKPQTDTQARPQIDDQKQVTEQVNVTRETSRIAERPTQERTTLVQTPVRPVQERTIVVQAPARPVQERIIQTRPQQQEQKIQCALVGKASPLYNVIQQRFQSQTSDMQWMPDQQRQQQSRVQQFMWDPQMGASQYRENQQQLRDLMGVPMQDRIQFQDEKELQEMLREYDLQGIEFRGVQTAPQEQIQFREVQRAPQGQIQFREVQRAPQQEQIQFREVQRAPQQEQIQYRELQRAPQQEQIQFRQVQRAPARLDLLERVRENMQQQQHPLQGKEFLACQSADNIYVYDVEPSLLIQTKDQGQERNPLQERYVALN